MMNFEVQRISLKIFVCAFISHSKEKVINSSILQDGRKTTVKDLPK